MMNIIMPISIMLWDAKLSVVMLHVIKLNVVLQSVVASMHVWQKVYFYSKLQTGAEFDHPSNLIHHLSQQ